MSNLVILNEVKDLNLFQDKTTQISIPRAGDPSPFRGSRRGWGAEWGREPNELVNRRSEIPIMLESMYICNPIAQLHKNVRTKKNIAAFAEDA
jgi:hypothetical protein